MLLFLDLVAQLLGDTPELLLGVEADTGMLDGVGGYRCEVVHHLTRGSSLEAPEVGQVDGASSLELYTDDVVQGDDSCSEVSTGDAGTAGDTSFDFIPARVRMFFLDRIVDGLSLTLAKVKLTLGDLES